MTVSNVVDLEKALLTGVVGCALGMPVALENAPFDKPSGPWAATFIIANQPSPRTLGDGGEDEHDGILQIDVNYPRLSGRAATLAMVGQITSYFYAGRALVYGATTVRVSSCGKPRSREVDGWYRTSLTIEWYARIAR